MGFVCIYRSPQKDRKVNSYLNTPKLCFYILGGCFLSLSLSMCIYIHDNVMMTMMMDEDEDEMRRMMMMMIKMMKMMKMMMNHIVHHGKGIKLRSKKSKQIS